MANETKRLRPAQIAEDESGFASLQAMALYEPANQAYSLQAVNTAHGLMLSARTEEAQQQAALDTARDNAVAKEWAFHNLMLRVKDQVIAQFGPDSNEVQALNLKKTSERKAPQRRKKTGGGTGS
ncbi:MAG: hypothetical protein JOZ02_09760 [Acidobacteria bacterium]|nr:hypothetical protein [Acidobacteriota bacterium]